MKCLVVVIGVFCFSALANVVCKDPSHQGDAGTEAQDVIANCRPSATGSAGGAVDGRDISENPETTLANLSERLVPATSGEGGSAGAQTGPATGPATDPTDPETADQVEEDDSGDTPTSGDGRPSGSQR